MSYEEIYGKVCLPEVIARGFQLDIHGRHVPTAGAIVLHDAEGNPVTGGPLSQAHLSQSGRNEQTTGPVIPPLRSYAEWYSEYSSVNKGRGDADVPRRVSSVVTAEHFKQLSYDGGRKREADLWSLVEDVLLDAERAGRYDPDVIGIHNTQPQRRWFISQYAHIQDLLMRQPTLRRACIICQWLEKTYRDSQRQPRLRGDEDVVLRQMLLTYIRGGELYKAIDAAISCEDGSYSCVLSAAHLQTVKEPWFLQTALVPLFGEYAHGELDQAWCGNEHRLDNLCQLYDDSLQYARPESGPRHGFDAVIGAALCGNLEVLEPAFLVNNNWRDVAWCTLRCALTVAFSKVLMDAGAPVEGEGYRAFLERQTGSDEDWTSTFGRQLVARLTQRLAGTFLSTAPTEEQMQIRFILQVLSPDDASWLDVELPAPTAQGPEWGADACNYREAVRIFTHLLLVMDGAYNEALSQHAVQAYCGDALASAMTKYAAFLAVLPKYPFDEGMVAMIGMARCLRDCRHRASVYAAFLRAAREYELERQTLSRERLEEQEAQLVRLFVESDTDQQVHAEVRRVLSQQVPLDELLTQNSLAEQILWEAMHADEPDDYLLVLRRGLEACAEFWLTQPHAELDAIADVSRILMHRVVPFLTEQHDSTATGEESRGDGKDAGAAAAPRSSSSNLTLPPMTEMEASEATFWYLFSETRTIARSHTRIAGELGAARATAAASLAASSAKTTADRTLLFQLAQDEVTELRRLTETTQRALRHGGAAVHRSVESISAILWLVQQLSEDVTLSLLNSGAEREELASMQSVFQLLEELDGAGYMEPNLLPRSSAAALYSQIRTMRVAFGQQAHRRQVQVELAKAHAAVNAS